MTYNERQYNPEVEQQLRIKQMYIVYPCDCNSCKNYWADSTADVIQVYKDSGIELITVYNSQIHSIAIQVFKTTLLSKEQYEQITKENV